MNLNIFKKAKKVHANMNTDTIRCSSDKLNDILQFQRNDILAFDGRTSFLYPSVDQNITKLPQKLSSQDKSDFIKVSSKSPILV